MSSVAHANTPTDQTPQGSDQSLTPGIPLNGSGETLSIGESGQLLNTQGLAGPSAIMARGINQNTAGASNNGGLLIYDHANVKWTANDTTEGKQLTQKFQKITLVGSFVYIVLAFIYVCPWVKVYIVRFYYGVLPSHVTGAL